MKISEILELKELIKMLFNPKDFIDYMTCLSVWSAIVGCLFTTFIPTFDNFIIPASILLIQILSIASIMSYEKGARDERKTMLLSLKEIDRAFAETNVIINELNDMLKLRSTNYNSSKNPVQYMQ